ncbi:RNA polymerase sigma-70 factor (ECF subfamily) [Granulicella aggregans]|uniref:RNA polymerase sigma-70 factor (ECF subfamily) n=1 Tax=Granulicella aggregans TaxID=474949 RepID=A0A7W8E6X3_9BACT|nr:sigma-70 family RNA polymerase sigma factor [Granulicella aggregans]MBB5061112.1 RNA polymerase sigma-70 factor (ECF subfamily) [Granulicella aggregans]
MNTAIPAPTTSFNEDTLRSDHDLICAILRGETQLYELLIRPYQQRIYRAALQHMKDEEDAREVTQESLLKAFLKLNTFQGRSQFSTWLTSITINEARNRLRQHRYLRMMSVDDRSGGEGKDIAASLPDTREIPLQLLERQELSCLLKRALDDLSSDYRTVFELRVIQELSTCETAERLKITSASVKTRLHRARSSLQISLRSTYRVATRTIAAIHAETSAA